MWRHRAKCEGYKDDYASCEGGLVGHGVRKGSSMAPGRRGSRRAGEPGRILPQTEV